ncbi:MAG: DUF711 family protein [Anaerolineae bacterium]|nr:DUF711 family protein [Anaerolineae bacterium]
MNIRSITAFHNAAYPLDNEALSTIGHVVFACHKALVAGGFTVQTARLATQPFPSFLQNMSSRQILTVSKALEEVSSTNHFDYVALGPIRLNDPAEYVDVIPHILKETENVFVCVEIANQLHGVDLSRIRATASAIQNIARLNGDGFANLRLAALANVGPWFPYFPAAYHGGGSPRIALAIEGADLMIAAIQKATSLREVRTQLIRLIESRAEQMESIVRQALENSGVAFQGIDFTLAPYPDDERSIGAALEQLGLPSFGMAGSLTVSAFLTDTLDRARFTRTGFCGLMLPVLEDSRLARRTAEGILHLSDLLFCSAVCGTGLDTIPLPGNIDQDKLTAILMDVAALALRLDKPLTARLMPLPGKEAGDPVIFDFEYFANSRVMDVEGDKLTGLLDRAKDIDIQPRRQASQS